MVSSTTLLLIVVLALAALVVVARLRQRPKKKPSKFFKECRNGRNGVAWYHMDHRFCDQPHTDPREALVNLYREFMELCDARGIRPILQAGGLIGWSFNERILPWDDDLDIFIFQEDIQKLCALDGYRSETCMIEVNPNHENRSPTEDPLNIIDARIISPQSGFFIDVGFLKPCERDVRYLRAKPERDRFLAINMYPPRRARFEGIGIFVPARATDYLVERYGPKVREPTYKEWIFDGDVWKKKYATD